jgi:hypothetical protein
VTPFDPESGQVVPDTGLSVEVYRDGSLVTQETIYRMLSQQMGFHYGANFPLDGDGTYEVRVAVGGVGLRRFGGFEGRFGDPGTASVSFEYSERARNDLPYTLLSDRQGERGALEAMAMGGNPVGRTPESLPGTPLGTGSLDDAQFRAARVADSRLGGDPYLAVVAETPFNRFVLPRMGLSARVGTGDGAAETDLRPALDPALGFHYGASVPGLTADSDVSVTVETPSVVARHEGYETAFLGTGSVALAR